MSKHTPGPWKAIGGYISYAGKDPEVGSVVIAYVGNYRDKELLPFNRDRWDADARLIAAAPDMYDALMSAVQFVERIGREYAEQHGVKYEDCTEGAELVKARAALAKARGE